MKKTTEKRVYTDSLKLYPLSEKERENRIVWASVRATLEAFRFKYKRSGKKSKSKWTFFERLLWLFKIVLKITGLYNRGVENAKKIKVTRFTLKVKGLPDVFEGFTLLHLSDLHIDSIPGFEEVVIEKIQPLRYDLCVMTGDYRRYTAGGYRKILPAMEKLLAAVEAPYGILATLGNHDTYRMVDDAEKMGVRMLVNESVTVEKEGAAITVTGTDDTFYYYSDSAVYALEEQTGGVKIALSHTSELHDVAAANGYALYLCGHTHGGQICLPGGIPVIAHQKEGKEFVKGMWHDNGLTGYTSSGVGVSGIPLRFNSTGEIVLITLSKE